MEGDNTQYTTNEVDDLVGKYEKLRLLEDEIGEYREQLVHRVKVTKSSGEIIKEINECIKLMERYENIPKVAELMQRIRNQKMGLESIIYISEKVAKQNV